MFHQLCVLRLVINTGQQGLQYHYSSATSAPPKIQTRQTMVFNDVDADKVLDDGWWLMFWRLGQGMAQNTAGTAMMNIVILVRMIEAIRVICLALSV